MKIKDGNVVQLKSGSPGMVVKEVRLNDHVVCAYYVENRFREELIQKNCLKKKLWASLLS